MPMKSIPISSFQLMFQPSPPPRSTLLSWHSRQFFRGEDRGAGGGAGEGMWMRMRMRMGGAGGVGVGVEVEVGV